MAAGLNRGLTSNFWWLRRANHLKFTEQCVMCTEKPCNIYWCREIWNTDDSPLFRYETFINFLTFSFSTRGERDTIFTMLTVPTSPTVNPPAGMTRPSVKSQLTAFLKNHFWAWHHSHPSLISYLGFLLWHLWLSYPLHTSVNCTQCLCTCTNSRIVQSPTKPNDEI